MPTQRRPPIPRPRIEPVSAAHPDPEVHLDEVVDEDNEVARRDRSALGNVAAESQDQTNQRLVIFGAMAFQAMFMIMAFTLTEQHLISGLEFLAAAGTTSVVQLAIVAHYFPGGQSIIKGWLGRQKP